MSSYLCTEISYSEIFLGFSQSNQEDTDILGFSGASHGLKGGCYHSGGIKSRLL